MSARRLDASALRDWAHIAVGELITYADEINRLNVFPVADADTGTNMLFTMRAAWAHAEARPSGTDASEMAAALAEGGLHGARGNSGVILSQILRGLADVTATAAAERGSGLVEIDGVIFASVLRHAVGLVVASMGRVVPGTIVSVLQAAAGAAEPVAGDSAELAAVVFAAAEAAVVALDKTPQQLDVLAEAGVVDAGGRGLVVLLDALTATLTGRSPQRDEYRPAPPHPKVPAETTAGLVSADRSAGIASADRSAGMVSADTSAGLVSADTSAGLVSADTSAGMVSTDTSAGMVSTDTSAPPQFEVMYLLSGCGADAVEELRRRLGQLGESVAIAAPGRVEGDDPANGRFSVHVHADDAGGAVEAGLAVGTLSRIQITALSGGTAHPHAGFTRGRAVLAVVDGDGAAELFTSEGAQVLRPHPDTPVSAKQLMRALVDTGAAQVMVLPNGYVAAEELVAGCTASGGWGVDVVPVPTGSMVQGLAALAVHDPQRQVVDDGYTMARAAAAARHGAVRVATEEALTWAGTCKPGDGLGMAGDEILIVGPGIAAAGAGLIDLLLSSGGELVTVLIGDGVDPSVGEELRAHVHRKHFGAELVIYYTGHRGDALLIGVE